MKIDDIHNNQVTHIKTTITNSSYKKYTNEKKNKYL